MSTRTSILIIILAIITGGLLYLALIGNAPKKVAVVSPTPTPMSPNAKTTLGLEAAPASLSSTLAMHTVAVTVDTTNHVNAIQIELGYDPTVVSNITIKPGTFFKQPTILLNTIDQPDGRISYALAEQIDLHGHAGQGIAALVSFDTVPNASTSSTTISFMPKTTVTADGILESVLKTTNNFTLPLTSAHQAPMIPATSSAK